MALHAWSELYEKTLTVITSYGSVVAYYVKAYSPPPWEHVSDRVVQSWTPEDVLQQIVQSESSLNAAGAGSDLYACTKQLQPWILGEPESYTDRVEFLNVAQTFVENLPMEDPFPLDLYEDPDSDVRQLRARCGTFYRLQRRMDMPLRWFHCYVNVYKRAAKVEPVLFSPRQDRARRQRITHTTEDVFERHGVAKRTRFEMNHVREESPVDWRDYGTQISDCDEDLTTSEPLSEIASETRNNTEQP